MTIRPESGVPIRLVKSVPIITVIKAIKDNLDKNLGFLYK